MAAFLVSKIKSNVSKKTVTDSAASKNRNAYHAAYSRAMHEEIGDIGELPAVADPKRRERCEADFAKWRAEYCKPRHGHPDSANHAKMCDRLQAAIESKDQWFGIMAPRGEAKSTTIVEAFAWAVASGRKKFPIAFSSSAKTTKNFVASFSSLFLDLPGIAEDYPEIIIPLKAKTEASKQRRVVYQGETVRVAWPSRDQGLYCFQFPDIPGNRSCFAHVISQSISSRMRGMFYAAPDASIVRPDLVVFDDIQDKAIAANPERVQDIWDKMVIDAAGLSGGD